MALQFFRKHKKYFNVLMIAAVFAMVTFGALYYAGDAIKVFTHWVEGENPNDPTVLVAYNQKITWSDRARAEYNCKNGMEFLNFAESLNSFGAYQQALAINKVFRNSVMLLRYRQVAESDKPDEVKQEELRKIVDATAVLLLEAKRAGIVVSNEMIYKSVISEWIAAGITEDGLLRAIIVRIFSGRTEMFYSLLQQEVTLSLYLDSLGQSARFVEEDAWSVYRTMRQQAKVQTVELKSGTYMGRVAPPTPEEIEAQFTKYKSFLPDDPESPFGYKTPRCVEFQWLAIDIKALEADQQVTEEEIKKYYEDNKDRFYVKKETPATKTDETDKTEAPKTEEAPADTEKKADEPGADATKSDTPAADAPKNDGNAAQPPKTLDAPEEAAPAAAQETPAEPAKEPAAETPKAETPAAEAPKTDAPKTEETPKVEEKPKEYQPLEEVREKIKTTLVRKKAGDEADRLAREALNTIQTAPGQIRLSNVASNKYMTVYSSKGLKTAKEIERLAGIGGAYAPGTARDPYTQPKFSELAFMLEGFVEKPRISLKIVPDLVLRDAVGNRYLFVITAKKEAEEPASLDQVHVQVIADLKRVAAYREAEKAAEDLINHAYATNLSIAAMQDVKLQAKSQDVRRSSAEYGSGTDKLLAAAVFEAVDTARRFGTVGNRTYESVTVFEVGKVTLATKKEFDEQRDQIAAFVLRSVQSNQLGTYTDPDRVTERSGCRETDFFKERRRDRGTNGDEE